MDQLERDGSLEDAMQKRSCLRYRNASGTLPQDLNLPGLDQTGAQFAELVAPIYGSMCLSKSQR